MKKLRFVDEDGKTYYPKGMSPEEQKEVWERHLETGSGFEVGGKKVTPVYEEDH